MAAVCPGQVLARGGMAALSQMIEALGRGLGPLLQPYALSAARNLIMNMGAAISGDVHAREMFYEAQCMAAISFANATSGLCQALCVNTSVAFYRPMPVGIAEAIYIPLSLRWEPGGNGAAAQVCEAAHISGDPLPALCNRLEVLRSQADMPANLRAFGVEEAEFLSKLPTISEEVSHDAFFFKASQRPSHKEVEGLLRQAYYGG